MNIHHTAIIHKKAQLGRNITIGPYSIVHEGVIIDDNVEIGSHCELGLQNKFSKGRQLKISRDSLIRSHCVFYSDSYFGEGLQTGHHVTVRERTNAGKNFQVGTFSDIQGHCLFGDYVRLHSNVHIAQGTKIGNFVWLFPFVMFTNDPHPPSDTRLGITVEDYAVIATKSTLLPGVLVGEGSLVGAASLVTKNVAPERIAVGNPARDIGPTSKIKLTENGETSAYPWRNHFNTGYPDDAIAEMMHRHS